MKLGVIALRLRYYKTYFGNFIGGSVELDTAIQNTLTKDMAFVIPLVDECAPNKYDTTMNQKIVERFGIVVALAGDDKQSDKMGFAAYDKVHNIRNEFIKALCGWIPIDAESMVCYRGGHLVDFNNGYMWYQYEFEFDSRIIMNGVGTAHIEESYNDDTEEPVPFNTIYMQLINIPDSRIPYDGNLPYPDNFPDVKLPDMANWIDFTKNPNAGAFAPRSFVTAFDIYHND